MRDPLVWMNDDGTVSFPRPDSIAARLILEQVALGDAWHEAEAALPDGWWLHGVERMGDRNWVASAWPLADAVYGYGPTPAAALRALAAKLRSYERSADH